MTDQTPRNATRVLFRGLRDVSPILPGIVPFGVLAGATALAAGLDADQAQGMSLILFAGASQLAAIELFARQAAWPVVLLTILVINLRFVMYSAVLAPWFADRSRPLRALLAAVLTDQAFAVTVARHRRDPAPRPLCWYYLGAAIALWATWQASTFAGIRIGALVPAGWQLDFSVPLVFLALLVPLVVDRASLLTAVVAAAVVLAGRTLPWNLGLILGVAVGIAAGLILEQRLSGVMKPTRSAP